MRAYRGSLPRASRPRTDFEAGWSIAGLLVDQILERFAAPETCEIIEKAFHAAFQPARRVVGAVRRQQDVSEVV